MKTIKNHLLCFPFVDSVTHVHIGAESATYLGFPEGGRWRRIGDSWELEQGLIKSYIFDENKCHECQGWGAPTGCRTCGTHCMGG